MNPRRMPSGDHTGDRSPQSPSVSLFGPPSAPSAHRSLGSETPWLETVACRLNATTPSGPIATSVGV